MPLRTPTLVKTLLLALSAVLALSSTGFAATIFTESMGNPSSTVTIPTHEANDGFDQDSYTYSGSGDVRTTTSSTGYTGASGSGNVFLTSSGGVDLVISGISTLGYVQGSYSLSFGAYKSTVASDLSDLSVEYSANGGNTWSAISFAAQPTGSGTATWRLISVSNLTLTQSSNAALRFTNTSTSNGVRLDDVSLTADQVPEPGYAMLAGVGLVTLLRRRR